MSYNDECFRYILPAIVNDHMYNNTDDFSATINYFYNRDDEEKENNFTLPSGEGIDELLNKYIDNIKYPMKFDINDLMIDGDVLVDYCNEIIQILKKKKLNY